jgi:hypothetical protein
VRVVKDHHGGGDLLGRASELRRAGVSDNAAIQELRAAGRHTLDEAISLAEDQGLDSVHYVLHRQYRWLLLAAGRAEPALDAVTARAFAEQERLEGLPNVRAFRELIQWAPELADLEREVQARGPVISYPRTGRLLGWLRRWVTDEQAARRIDERLTVRAISSRVADVLDKAPQPPGTPLRGSFGHDIALHYLTNLAGLHDWRPPAN